MSSKQADAALAKQQIQSEKSKENNDPDWSPDEFNTLAKLNQRSQHC